MNIIYEERESDSPYIESIMHGQTMRDGATTRPAEIHWHMVFARHNGNVYSFVVGPWTSSGVVTVPEGAEILWIKFKLGTFMPHLPPNKLRDMETVLAEGASNSFWLKGAAWQLPDYDNVETFVARLVRDDLLARDPVVNAALHDQLPEMAARTVRHRFLRATGLTQSHIRQMQRAQHAAALLQQGTSILDTVFETGYFDQPHLTRSLKRFIGYTPAQIIQLSKPE
jgi:AraC-like DNA-binding protein